MSKNISTKVESVNHSPIDEGWQAGYGFYAGCLRPEEKRTNPYPIGSNDSNLWESGFMDGLRERDQERSE